MVIDKYPHLSRLKLCELSRHLTRSEQDMEERLAAREKQVREVDDDKPDPIRKRLFFLLLKNRRQRQAVDEAMASRENTDRASSLFLERHATAVSSSMTVAAPDMARLTTAEHADSAENPRTTDPAFHSTSSTRCILESGGARAPHVPARVSRRTRESRIHGVPPRLRTAFTRMFAVLAQCLRFAIPGGRSTS
jgi:hypothetical protein